MAEKTREAGRPRLRVKGRAVTGRGVVALVAAVALIWFVVVNTQSVQVRLWVPTVHAPLWVVLAVTALVAGAIGWFAGRRRLRRDRR